MRKLWREYRRKGVDFWVKRSTSATNPDEEVMPFLASYFMSVKSIGTLSFTKVLILMASRELMLLVNRPSNIQ